MNINDSADDAVLTQTARDLFLKHFCRTTDFTLLFSDEYLRSQTQHDADPDWWYQYCCMKVAEPNHERISSFEFQETVADAEARLQVSRAFGARAWTVSVRWEPPTSFTGSLAFCSPTDSLYQANAKDFLNKSKWRPDISHGFAEPIEQNLRPWLFSIDEVVDCLYKCIQDADTAPHGLVLVTGSTNAAKSKIARGIIWKRLMQLVDTKPKRRPHLVTFEDPIEQYFTDEKQYLDLNSGELPFIDYTPRNANNDCKGLEEALSAALRQTPAAFYIGELRESDGIRHSVIFGGTGHMVVATAHAANLVEAVSKILSALEADTPGSRALFVPKIMAVIHLTTLDTMIDGHGEKSPRKVAGIVPSIYRRTSQGMQNLIADGLTSLMPNFPEPQISGQFGSLGRQYFTRILGEPRFCLSETPQTDNSRALVQVWQDVRQLNTSRNNGSLATGVKIATGSRSLIDRALMEDLFGH